jgi:WD40 repeat protein
VAGPYDVIVRAVALSGDGTRAALGTVAGDIFCWDVDTETLVWSFRETLPVRRTCFSPDASLLAFACDGNVVHILDAESGIPHQQWVGGPRYVKSLVWDESGVLFCAGATQGVCRWDVGDPSSPKRTRRVLASGARGH